MTRNPFGFDRIQQSGIRCYRAHIHHGFDGHACFSQIQCSQITIIMPSEHHCCLSRFHGIEFHQALCCTRQNHTRQVVVTENHGLIKATARYNTLRCTDFIHAFALNNRQIVVGKPCITGGFSQYGNLWMTFNRSHQALFNFSSFLTCCIQTCIVQTPPQDFLLLDQ